MSERKIHDEQNGQKESRFEMKKENMSNNVDKLPPISNYDIVNHLVNNMADLFIVINLTEGFNPLTALETHLCFQHLSNNF